MWNVGTPRPDTAGRVLDRPARGRVPSSGNCEGQSTDAGQAGGPSCSSGEALVMRVEPRGRVALVRSVDQPGLSGRSRVSEPKQQDKPFDISKMGCVGGVSEGLGQQGCSWGGRGVDRRVRSGSRQESVSDLESDVVGELLPASGESGGDP